MGRINEGPISWAPERVSNAIEQDDLYVEMTFARVMDDVGLDAPGHRAKLVHGLGLRLFRCLFVAYPDKLDAIYAPSDFLVDLIPALLASRHVAHGAVGELGPELASQAIRICGGARSRTGCTTSAISTMPSSSWTSRTTIVPTTCRSCSCWTGPAAVAAVATLAAAAAAAAVAGKPAAPAAALWCGG